MTTGIKKIILSVLFLAFFACNQPCRGISPDRKENTKVINDFENLSSLENCKGSIGLTREFHSHGNSCLKLTESLGKPLWFETQEFTKDWSAYRLLKFDIYNPSTRLYYGTLQIFDEAGTDKQAEFQGQSYTGEKLLSGEI